MSNERDSWMKAKIFKYQIPRLFLINWEKIPRCRTILQFVSKACGHERFKRVVDEVARLMFECIEPREAHMMLATTIGIIT
jgi:hypothetical protein